jgi:hypothetical protein
MAAGWTSDRRNDLPWLSVKLVVPRGDLVWSSSGIDTPTMEANAAGLDWAREHVTAWAEIQREESPRPVAVTEVSDDPFLYHYPRGRE